MKINKKKFQVIAVAGLLTVGVVGGTLAWFTSQDKLTNKFTTGSINDPNTDGVKIEEHFEEPKNVTPGELTDKQVQVKNTASYDQFIRVKLTPKFVDVNNDRSEIKQVTIKEGENNTTKDLDTSKIVFKFSTNKNDSKEDGTWYDAGDGYFYYIGKVAPDTTTNKLLEAVELDKSAGNEYRGIGFDVDVVTDSIQATHDAYLDWGNEKDTKIPEVLKEKFKELQDKEGTTESKNTIPEDKITNKEPNKEK